MRDRFGLTTFGVDDVAVRPGIKWSHARGKLASWVADMDFPIAPAIIERLRGRAAVDVGYPDWDEIGRSRLPERFAERMDNRFGWRPEADRLHELCEVMQGVELAINHLTERGDGVVLHLPSYPPFLASIAQIGRQLIEVPAIATVDGFRWDYDELDRRLTAARWHEGAARLWLLCHPHNPTGRVFRRPELEQIADLAERHDLVVVSDEIHAELVYTPNEHVPFATLGDDVAARTVTVTSSSKAFNLAGLRWAILHCGVDRLQREIAELPSHYLGAPNLMAVEATDAAWSDGDEWLAAVLAVLDDNRSRLGKLLAEHLPGAGYHEPEATYLAWLDCAALGFGDDPAATFRDRGVEVYSGLKFGTGGSGFVRLNFATSPVVLDAIVTRMAGR
jgi:cystathionine beta-lyase